jgi:hypothetical protein
MIMATTPAWAVLHTKASRLEHLFSHLDEDRNEFRLIKLSSGIKTDPIHCTLLHVTGNHAFNYEALSYVWGDPSQLAVIFLNGYDFDVTLNLRRALSELRSKTEDVVLWIDAICINQANLKERGSQVCRMREIYSNAERVIAWIGEEAEDTIFAIEMLHEAESQGFSKDFFLRSFSSSKYTRHVIALKQLYLRDYWTRVWIVQEISSARSVILRCGQFSIAWSTMIRFGEAFMNSGIINDPSQGEGKSSPESDGGPSTLDLHSHRMFLFEFGPKQLPPPGHTRQKSGHPLLQTLLKNRNKSSSDPRDKVFGLLGIVNSNSIGHDKLQINYNLPVKDVYSGVVQAVVGTTQRLDIICSSRPGVLVGGWNVRPEQLKLPSWAPDWSVCPSVRRFNNMGVPFRAAGSSIAQTVFCSNGQILTAKGFFLGSISLCGDVCNLRNPSEDAKSWRDLIQCVIGWRKNLYSLTKDGSSMEEAFFRILYANFTEYFEKSSDPEMLLHFAKLKMICMGLEIFGAVLANHLLHGRHPAEMTTFLELMYRATGGRRFISFSLDTQCFTESVFSHSDMTSSDLMIGLGPNTTQKGDKVCILLGCHVPVIIRPEGDHYIFIGEAYIHGVMYGELFERLNISKSEPRSFSLH